MTIVNNVESNDKVTEILTEENEAFEINDVSEELLQVKEEISENKIIRKSKRISRPKTTKKVKKKFKKSSMTIEIKNEAIESDISQSKDDLLDDNNDVYDSDGTVDLNESEDDKCSDPNECDLFMDHEKFAGFPKVIIENSKLIFRGKKLLDLLSRYVFRLL